MLCVVLPNLQYVFAEETELVVDVDIDWTVGSKGFPTLEFAILCVVRNADLDAEACLVNLLGLPVLDKVEILDGNGVVMLRKVAELQAVILTNLPNAQLVVVDVSVALTLHIKVEFITAVGGNCHVVDLVVVCAHSCIV